MELDDLKLEWQSLQARLARQEALNLHLLREGRLERLRRGLRPLAWGQGLSLAFGLGLAVLSASFWSAHLHEPHLLATGLLMHLYGLATILFSARTLVLLDRLDYTQPVLVIQQRLSRLRRFYVLGGLWLGLPWFVLWVPCLEMAFVALFGVDLFIHAPSVLLWLLISGFAGWVPVLGLLLWSRTRPALARKLETFAAGANLNRAQAQLDDLAHFDQD